MSHTTYVPQPGTIPFRAIEHLKSLPAWTELSTVVLCEGIGQSTNNFPAIMRPAVDGGAVCSRRKPGVGGNLLWWSLGNGKPPPLIDEPDADDDQALDAAARRPREKPPLIPLLAPSKPEAKPEVKLPRYTDPGSWPFAAPPAAAPAVEVKPNTSKCRHDNVIGSCHFCDDIASGKRCDHGAPIDGKCNQCADEICAEVRERLAEPGVETFAEKMVPEPRRTCSHGVAMTTHCQACVTEIYADIKGEVALPPITAPLPRVRAGTAPARWGIFSDGDFHIQKAGQLMVLERSELEAMLAFFERLAVSA